jgi:uncharacterized membrane protein
MFDRIEMQRIQKIKEVNEKISLEFDIPINCIVMNRSDHYPAAYFRSSLFILVLSFLVFYFIPFDLQDPIWLMAQAFGAILIGQILTLFPRYKRLFVANSEFKEECYQQALEQGQILGVLGEENSLYLFISQFERRVELFIPDQLYGVKIEQNIRVPFKKWIKSLKHDAIDSGLEEFYRSIFLAPGAAIEVIEKDEMEKKEPLPNPNETTNAPTSDSP